MQEYKIKWRSYEYEPIDRPDDWYWALGVLALSFAITAIILGNILFAVLIIVAAFAIAVQSKKLPDIIDFEINHKGVRVGNSLYPYETLEAYWVEEEIADQEIIIRSSKNFMPYIVIPVAGQNADSIRDYLSHYLPEEEMREPLAHKLLEYFGI